MKVINDIINLLKNDDVLFKLNYETENNNKYEISYSFIDYIIPNFEDMHLLFKDIKNKTEETKDTINVYFNLINTNDPTKNRDKSWVINSDENPKEMEEQIIKLVEYINQRSNIRKKEDYEFEMKFIITKPIQSENNVRRIYSFDNFKENLMDYSLKNILINFPKDNFNVHKKDYFVFLIDETIKEFYTGNVFFIHNIDEVSEILNLIDSKSFNINEALNFYNNNFFFKSNQIVITPYFYKLIERSEFSEINDLFDNIVQYISLIFLSQNATLSDEDTLSSSIKGYTLLQIRNNLLTDNLSNTFLFDIFEWIYSGDKKEVRFEIATNIISLEYNGNINNINEDVIDSIESNYIIYSIDNVERYIDIKSNIISSVSEQGNSYADSINSLISKLKNALGLNITFFLSIIIFNLIENKNETFFNFEIAVISMFIILGSFIFLLISTKTAMIDLYKYHNNIINIQNSYDKLIAENDIKRTISNFYDEDTFNQAQKELLHYSMLGVYSLIFILVGILIVTPEIRNYLKNQNIYFYFVMICSIVLLLICLKDIISEDIIFKYKYNKGKKISYNFNILKS